MMTKDNLIFLGACSLLGPYLSNSAFLPPSLVQENALNAINWSKALYERVHGGGIVATAAAPAPFHSPWYRIERQNSDGNWSDSVIAELLLSFPSKALAQEAIDKYGTRSFSYRVVKK